MPRSLNKVLLIGYVTDEPKIRTFDSGAKVANITVATNDSRLNKETGQREETTEWNRVVFWNNMANTVESYVHKGSRLYVEGRLSTRNYDKDGQRIYRTEILADNMIMLDSRGDHGNGGSVNSQGGNPSTYSFNGGGNNNYGSRSAGGTYGNSSANNNYGSRSAGGWNSNQNQQNNQGGGNTPPWSNVTNNSDGNNGGQRGGWGNSGNQNQQYGAAAAAKGSNQNQQGANSAANNNGSLGPWTNPTFNKNWNHPSGGNTGSFNAGFNNQYSSNNGGQAQNQNQGQSSGQMPQGVSMGMPQNQGGTNAGNGGFNNSNAGNGGFNSSNAGNSGFNGGNAGPSQGSMGGGDDDIPF